MAIRPRVRNLYYLKLIEPKNQQSSALAFKRNDVQNWLNDLPTVNTGMVTRLLHNKLNQINDTVISFQDQFETLEALQPTYYSVEAFLHSKICGQSLPLSEQVLKITDLHIQILQDYANAYWYLLKTGQKLLGNRSFTKQLPILIQRLIRLLSNILKTHYLANLAEPTWIWMDIHSLFNILPDKICENTRIKEYSSSGEITTTITDTYKKILALSTADPYGMYDRETLRIDHFLSQWAPAIKLERIAPGQIPLGFFVSMDNDKAPCWADIDVDVDEESEIYQIYMDDMVNTMFKKTVVMKSNLGRYFAATAFPVTENSFDPELLKHLQQRWEGKPFKQQVTFGSCLHWEVAIGLNAISHTLVDTDNTTEQALFRAEAASRTSLKCPLDSDNQIAIGSLVGYRKIDADKKQFGLGLISKIIAPNTQSDTQFELKNITNTVQVVTIELVVDDNKKNRNKKAIEDNRDSLQILALSFSKLNDGNTRNYLIVESRSFKVSDTIVINDSDRSYGAMLTKLNNLGLGYIVIEYQNITEVKQLEAIPATGYDFL